MRPQSTSPACLAVSLALVLTLLTGCGDSSESPGSPAGGDSLPKGSLLIGVRQTPEYALPGQFPQHARGLVAALYSDGRIVRTKDVTKVGDSDSYETGTVSKKDYEEFAAFLKTDEVSKAPKVPHFRLHAATRVTTLHTEAGLEKWVTELPDSTSIWAKVQERLLNLPLADGHAADKDTVDGASKEDE
jgi:hypothetical protein